MNYEKKYKEALKWMQGLYDGLHGATKEEAEKYFPELKENEDEKIKREIVAYINELADLKNEKIPTKWLDWLEKQGEKKPTDNVEPKFKVGNWYQCTKDFFGKGVTFDKNTAYYCAKEGCLQNEYGCHIAIVKDLYDNFKLWTIEDAKDGDVLVDEDNNIGIYIEEKDDLYWYSRIYLGCDNRLRGFSIGAYHKHNNTKPATKEQRDLLFSKMKEEGYEWDSEKKELEKIKVKALDADKVIEWLKDTIKASAENYGVFKATRLILPYNSLEDLINDFKEDFGL